MLFLLQNGYTDVAAMMFYQKAVVDLAKGAFDYAFAPKRLGYDPDTDSFIYINEQISEVLSNAEVVVG